MLESRHLLGKGTLYLINTDHEASLAGLVHESARGTVL